MKIQLNQFLTSISLALDLAGGKALHVIHLNHGQRVAYMVLRLAELLTLRREDKMELYYTALLHDIGITEAFLEYHTHEDLIREHCIFGARSLEGIHLFSNRVVKTILHHHENWDGSGPFGKRDDEISLMAQMVRIADEVELHYQKERPNYQQRESLKDLIHTYRGVYFSKSISSTMLHLFEEERFWLDLSLYNQDMILERIAPSRGKELSFHDVKELITILAAIIDQKSSFTGKHTLGIVEKALILARSRDFSKEELTSLEIGAYLHDLGKLAVPKEILEKPGKLTHREFTIIKSHAYYTKILLQMVEGMERIAELAGNHHEKLDGTGYPEGLTKERLSYAEQSIAVLDIYQALIEDRPYRRGMSHSKALKIMYKMAEEKKISQEITEEVDRCFS